MESQLAPCNNLSGKALWCPLTHTHTKANPNKCTRAKLLLLCCPVCSSPALPAEAAPQGHPAPYPRLIWRVWREEQQGRGAERAALLAALSSPWHLPKKAPCAWAGWADPHPKILVAIQEAEQVTSSLWQPKYARYIGCVALFPKILQSWFLILLQGNF